MRWNALSDEHCSLARTLSVVGDRWALIIVRDALLGVCRFDDFQTRLGIARRVLTERLAHMVETGIFERVRYQDRPPRYEYRLTQRGHELQTVVLSMIQWGDAHLAGAEGPPAIHCHLACGHDFDPVTTCSVCGDPISVGTVRTRAADWVRKPEKQPTK